MSTSQAIEALRDLLASPTVKGWRAICQLLADLPDASEALTLALDYVDTHADTWKPDLRPCPAIWAYQLLAGVDQPRLRVVRVLDYDKAGRVIYNDRRFNLDGAVHLPTMLPPNRDTLAHVAACPWLKRLHTLNLRENHLDADDINVFIGSTAMPELHTLDLYYNDIEAGQLFLDPFVNPIRQLHLGLNGASYSDLAEALATTAQLTNLRSLEIDWIYYNSFEDLEWVATNTNLHASVRRTIEKTAAERQEYDETNE